MIGSRSWHHSTTSRANANSCHSHGHWHGTVRSVKQPAQKIIVNGAGRKAVTMSSSFDRSAYDKAILANTIEAEKLATQIRARADGTDDESHPTRDVEIHALETNGLRDCYYVGHKNTDVDSVASAIGAADLFEGIATRSEVEVNGEIVFACEYAGISLPPYMPDIEGACDAYNVNQGIVLVDHNEPRQILDAVGEVAFPPSSGSVSNSVGSKKATVSMLSRIRGCIDHHAVSSDFFTSQPIFVDIRPWGSACSIVTHHYVRCGKPMPRHVARVLLCGILSDTVNLTSPTTTNADRLFSTLLTFLGEVDDPNTLAKNMFKAKTAYLVNLSPFAIVRADQKDYRIAGQRIGWATVEVNEPQKILDKADELLLELRVLKKEKSLDFAFLTCVDLVNKQSDLLCCGIGEVMMAEKVFGGASRSPLPPQKLRRFRSFCVENNNNNVVNTVITPSSAAGGKGDSRNPTGSSTADASNAVGAHADSQGSIERSARVETSASQSPRDEQRQQQHRRVYRLDQALMDLGNRMSRKKEFIPPIKKLLSSGWVPHVTLSTLVGGGSSTQSSERSPGKQSLSEVDSVDPESIKLAMLVEKLHTENSEKTTSDDTSCDAAVSAWSKVRNMELAMTPQVVSKHVCADGRGCTLIRQFSASSEPVQSYSLEDFIEVCEQSSSSAAADDGGE